MKATQLRMMARTRKRDMYHPTVLFFRVCAFSFDCDVRLIACACRQGSADGHKKRPTDLDVGSSNVRKSRTLAAVKRSRHELSRALTTAHAPRVAWAACHDGGLGGVVLCAIICGCGGGVVWCRSGSCGGGLLIESTCGCAAE